MSKIFPGCYIVDENSFNRTAKLLRVVETSEIGYKVIVVELINDDIFHQDKDLLKTDSSNTFFKYITHKDFSTHGFPEENHIRFINPYDKHVVVLENYEDALVHLYKHMNIAEEIKRKTIIQNGIRMHMFLEYTEKIKMLKPEIFV